MKNEIPNNTTRNAVIYCRVSTKEQVDEGNSLVSQERLCREYAAKNDYEIVRVFIEKGESAKTAKRKELLNMLDLCTKKKGSIQVVIAYKVDRISRNLADYSNIKIRLRRAEVEIKSVTEHFEDTPAGRFMENIIANVSQFDNEVRAERSVGGMKEAMREGRYVWKAPLGYKNSKVENKSTIVPNKLAPLIRETFELIAQRNYSTEIIRLMIHKKGLVDRKGQPICKSYFFRLIRNPVYKGVIKKFDETSVGTYEAIVPETLFDDVQTALKGRRRKIRNYLKDNPDFPLRGFIANGHGRSLLGYWAKGKRLKYPYYSFNLPNTTIRKEILESIFKSLLGHLTLDKNHLSELKVNLKKHFVKKLSDEGLSKSALEKQITDVNQQIDVLINLRGRENISESLFTIRINRLEMELENLKSSLNRDFNQKINIPDVLSFATKALVSLDVIWEEAPVHIKRRLQVFVFPQGLIFDGSKLRTPKICSIFKFKLIFDEVNFPKVPLREPRKNTVYGTNYSPSDKNLLKDKEFWQEIVDDLKELKIIMEPKSVPDPEEEEIFFIGTTPEKWWWKKVGKFQ